MNPKILSGRQIDVFIHLTSGIDIKAGHVDETTKDLRKLKEWVFDNIATNFPKAVEE